MDVAFRYMIEFVLADTDLTGLRFAVSPLNELALSLRVLRSPGRHPLHRPWLDALDTGGLDLPVLRALTTPRGWTPDFLSPRPTAPETSVETELDRLAATGADRVAADLAALHARIPEVLAGNPAAVLARVVTALRGLWDAGFAPFWGRMKAVLEADVAHRARVMSRGGLGAMLTGVSDRISFRGTVVAVRIRDAPPRRVEVRGAGLTLMPSLFALHTAVPVDPEAPPMLIYAARGTGTLWEKGVTRARPGLAGILGRTRAELLTSLDEPATSTELARRSGVTVSAVNQHLRALRDGRLLESRRRGRSVEYFRTAVGEALVDG